jgi:NAD kinase
MSLLYIKKLHALERHAQKWVPVLGINADVGGHLKRIEKGRLNKNLEHYFELT